MNKQGTNSVGKESAESTGGKKERALSGIFRVTGTAQRSKTFRFSLFHITIKTYRLSTNINRRDLLRKECVCVCVCVCVCGGGGGGGQHKVGSLYSFLQPHFLPTPEV